MWIDGIILAVYLLLSFLIGIFANRIMKGGRSDSESGYFLGNKSMPGYLTGISNAVNAMNSDVMPTYMGIALAVGLPVCWFYFSRAGLGIFLAGMLFFARWKQLNVATGPEFFSVRFGQNGGWFLRAFTSVYSVLFTIVPWMGAGLLASHIIFGQVFGYESKLFTLAMLLPLMLLYVWVSGYAGVLITNLFQTIIIVVACVAVCVVMLCDFGGPAGLNEAVANAMGGADSPALSIWPQDGNPYVSPLLVGVWLILGCVGMGSNVSVDGQRIISCKNVREAVKTGIWTQLALFVMLMLVTLPALGVLAQQPELFTAPAAEREAVYGQLVKNYLPIGIKGLTLAALAAAVMSTISTQLNYSAQTITHDVFGQFFKFSPKQAVTVGRLVMVGVMALSILVVYFSSSLISIAILITGLMASSALIGWGYWWYWRTNIYSWYAAMIGGPLVYTACRLGLPLIPWWAAQLEKDANTADMMNICVGVISMVLTTILVLIVTFVTPPDKPEVLDEFYRRARPMGYWKPVQERLRAKGQLRQEPKQLLLGGLITALAGAVGLALVIMALSELFVGRYVPAGMFSAGAVIVGLIFKKLFNWHLYRLEGKEEDSAGNVEAVSSQQQE